MARGLTDEPVSYGGALAAALRGKRLSFRRHWRLLLLCYREDLLAEYTAGRITRERFEAKVERACRMFYERDRKAARTR